MVVLAMTASYQVFAKTKKPGISKQADALVYKGVDADKLSPGVNVVPDKIKDLHFRFTHNFNEGDELMTVTLSHVLENGDVIAGWRTTNEGGKWVLLVEIDGKPLNSGQVQTLGSPKGNVVLDIYTSDDEKGSYSTKGHKYQLDVVIRKGNGEIETIKRQVTV